MRPNRSLNRTLHCVPAFVQAKTLAQIPSRCSGPVSLDVSHHIRNAVATRNSALTPGLRKLMIASSANTKLKARAPRLRTLPAGRSSQARSWLALRASVLRRAVSSQGTAQERRAEVNAGAVSQCNRGAQTTRIGPTLGVRGSGPISRLKPITWQTGTSTSSLRQNHPAATWTPRIVPPHESGFRFANTASQISLSRQTHYFHQLQCWLTLRSTGPIAAGRHLGYKSLAQTPARHNGPVSSNVRPHHNRRLRTTSDPNPRESNTFKLGMFRFSSACGQLTQKTDVTTCCSRC